MSTTPPDPSSPAAPLDATGPLPVPGGPADAATPAPAGASAPARTDGLTDSDVALHLLGAEVFQLLDPPALLRLAPLFTATRVQAGEVIARQGTVDTTLWVLIEGTLRLERAHDSGRVETLGHRSYGAVVGVRGVFTDVPRPNSVVAATDGWLLAADRDALLRLLRAAPEIDDLLLLPDEARLQMTARRDEDAGEGEYEIRVYRRHVLALVTGLLGPAALLVVALTVGAGLSATTAAPGAVGLWALVSLALPGAWAWWAWLNWSEDRLIVTNQRIVMLETRPFIAADRREALMARVQDVSSRSPSLLARLLDYGTVTVNTASSAGKIVWRMAAHPDALKGDIFEQMSRARARAQAERRAFIEGQLRRAIGEGRLAADTATAQRAPGGAPAAAPRAAAAPATAGAAGVSLVRRIVAAVLYFVPLTEVRDGSRLVWRRHWWLLLRATALPLTLLAATAALVVNGAAGGHAGAGRALVALGVAAFGWLWWRYEDWRNDQYILTDNHVIDIESLPLGLFKDQRQASLDAVQDVRFSIPNPLAMILRYGTVTIQTAADTGNFSFDGVAHPEHVQGLIFERINARRARLEAEAEQKRADEMVQWLATYDALRREGPPPTATG